MDIGGRLFAILVIFTALEKEILSEFRFCYFGPHKFGFDECPGGVVLKKPVQTKCTFFAKGSNIGDGRISVSTSVCESSAVEDADASQANPTRTFESKKLQEITYDGDISSPTKGVDASTLSDCISSCFSSWVEPEQIPILSGNGGHAEPIYKYPSLTPIMKVEQEKITEQLFMKLILDDLSNQAGELRVAKLLRASFIVMSTHCPHPYITQSFINKTLDAFFYFSKNANKTVKDIGVREFHQIMNVLAQCRTFDTYNSFRIIPQNCSDFPTIIGGDVTFPNGTTQRFMFTETYQKLDPFIESSWQVVSFINAHCFRDMADEFNLHHVYEVAMETLFSEFILLRWVNPPEIENENFWNNLMGTPNFQIEVQNINTCAKLAYASNPYTQRLERPFKKENAKDRKNDDELPSTGDGWLKSEPEYWNMYKKKGGFRRIIEYIGGTCFKSEAERESAKSDIVSSCPKSETDE